MDLHSAKHFAYVILVNTDKISMKFIIEIPFDKWEYWESENFSKNTTSNWLNQEYKTGLPGSKTPLTFTRYGNIINRH